MNRRTWLKTGMAALGSLAVRGLPFPVQASGRDGETIQSAGERSFRHRGYLGWITDLATEPDPNADWPSMRLDERLLEDYSRTFNLMKMLGFNEISIWGLYVSRSWPVDIQSSVAGGRGAMVQKLVGEAHKRGIRVYSGLGVYSWGFEEIIEAHPELRHGNRQVMCASNPKCWDWMRRVINFVFERFPVDGVSMQSADQGRCRCEQCRVHSDAQYHALLNVRSAEYIRSRWPKKTIGVNSWGMQFGDRNILPSLVATSKPIDYLIDVHDSSRHGGPGYRRKLIESLACDFGTLGGPQVEPPQHWRRDRWFLPTLRRAGEHLQQLFDDGGRACEYFFHILANPGDEMSLWVAGKTLSAPLTPWEKHVEASVEQVFETRKNSTRDAMGQFLLDAEEAYFRYLPPEACGTISLEPLLGNRPGPPVYLDRLHASERALYRKELHRIRADAEKLLPDVPRQEKMRTVIRCLDSVIADLTQTEKA